MNELNVFRSEQQVGQPATGAAAQMMVSRQAQEVQAAMVVAKRFPRDEAQAMDRILNACQRQSLAEAAVYEYPRGGETVTGPSIRLAEALAQNWGNVDFGVIELEQRPGESQVMAYAWDLETNTRQSKVFTVPHVRKTRNGTSPLTDPRDIYEMVANQGARRMRSCILGIIPGDVVDAAVAQCDKTLKSANKAPLEERIVTMCSKFQDDFQIGKEALEAYIGRKSKAFSEADVVRLAKVYRSLKDGVIGNEYFMDKLKSSAPAADAEQNEHGSDKPAGGDEASCENQAEPQAVSMDEL